MWQCKTGIALLTIYIIVALGAAVGTVPREFFRHPVERFIVRVSCGLLWPLLLGYLIAQATATKAKG